MSDSALSGPILLVGAGGQLGQALSVELAALGPVVAWSRRELDLERCDDIGAQIRALHPALVVNAAAYTAVDAAEGDAERCWRVNVRAPLELAGAAADCGAPLVHFSTNYVFDGTLDRPYREDDPTSPVSVYGSTKAEGEARVAEANATHAIIRTSALYSATGNNFVRRIRALARERDELQVVGDQYVSLTPVDVVASGAVQVARALSGPFSRAAAGIYHLTTQGSASWYEIAKRVMLLPDDRPGQRMATLHEVTTEEFPTPARRPRNGVLDTGRFTSVTGIEAPMWEDALDRFLRDAALP